MTLGAVGAGTAIGMKLPDWYGWNIDPMGPGVGLALVLGLTAYALYRFYIGAALTVLLTAWAALATWVLLKHGNFHPPTYAGNLPKYLLNFWAGLPRDMHRWMPYLAAGSFLAGMSISILWPKLGSTIFWSTAGATTTFCTVSIALYHFRPHTLDRLPRHVGPQLACLGGAVALGMLLQWAMMPRKKKEKSPAPEQQPEHSH